MDKARTARIWISASGMTALVALYAFWLITEAPTYWETFLFVTLLFLLYAAALLRFIPYFQAYISTGSEPHLERVGERTFRRCGVRELAKVALLIMALRLMQLLLTYLIRLRVFGYTETFFVAQRLWLDFFHVDRCFPAYPLLSNVFWFFSFNFNHARFIASYLFTALAGAALYYWVLLDFDRTVASHTLLTFFLLPASCLLLGTTPDGLFLLLSIMCLYFYRKRLFPVANLFAMGAVCTHLLGALLFVPGLIEFSQMLISDLKAHREERSGYLVRQILSALSFLLIPFGFALVMLYSSIRFGNMTALFRAATEAYGYRASLPFSAAADVFDRLLNAMHTQTGAPLLRVLGSSLADIVYLLGGAALLVVAPGRIRTSYIAYMLVAFPMILCTGTLHEGARLMSLCVPFVLTLAFLTRSKWVRRGTYLLLAAAHLLYLAAVVCGYAGYGV